MPLRSLKIVNLKTVNCFIWFCNWVFKLRKTALRMLCTSLASGVYFCCKVSYLILKGFVVRLRLLSKTQLFELSN